MRTLKWEGGGNAAELQKQGQAFVICRGRGWGGGALSKEAGGREKSREGDKDIISQLK